MTDQYLVYATAAVILGLVGTQVWRKSFDPFAPIWMFLVGYGHIYVLQAIGTRDYAVRVRGLDLVTQGNARALWALLWFLAVYHWGPARMLARRMPAAPTRWSAPVVVAMCPVMIAWGLFGTIHLLRGSYGLDDTGEVNLLRQFPIMLLIAGILLIVTARAGDRPRPLMTIAGVTITVLYVLIWMYNGKRSHSVIGILTGVCAFYASRGRRPSLPVLGATAFAGALVLSVAIGWRNNPNYERTPSGFLQFVGDFDLDAILVNASVKSRVEDGAFLTPELESRETEEYPAFLLMLDTVPTRAEYDHGAPYLRVFSSYIPRLVWPSKPIYGREKWIAAWIAGSEFKREENFTGPAIGILGGTQLNGGATATVVVLGLLAMLLRTGYEYYRLYGFTPWAQAWWALTYYNAWLMTVNDDPAVWFYYLYGHTALPPMAFLWLYNRIYGRADAYAPAPIATAPHMEVAPA